MNKGIENILKLSHKFERMIKIADAFQIGDLQAALGQKQDRKSGATGADRDYYAQDKINSIVTDICNKFKVADETSCGIFINMKPGGAIYFTVNIPAEAAKAAGIANYLRSLYANDMGAKVLTWCKANNKQPSAEIQGASWINF